jgi:hypothetical protein
MSSQAHRIKKMRTWWICFLILLACGQRAADAKDGGASKLADSYATAAIRIVPAGMLEDDEVLQSLAESDKLPQFLQRERSAVQIVKEMISEEVDPPRDFPLIGPARLCHDHYECSVRCNEVTRLKLPIPLAITVRNVQRTLVVDKTFFRMVEK